MQNTYINNYKFTEANHIGLIPWENDFLAELDIFIEQLCAQKNVQEENETNLSSYNKQDVIIVFPHSRPKRYFESRYKEKAKAEQHAFILPHIMTGNDFLTTCLSHFERGQKPYEELGFLDRIALIYKSITLVAQDLPEGAVLRRLLETTTPSESETGDRSSLHQNNLAKVFPWAKSLDALFEECFSQMTTMVNIDHADGEVSAFGVALLAQLQALYTTYQELLCGESIFSDEYSLYRASTPAYSAHRAAEYVQMYQGIQQQNTPFALSRTISEAEKEALCANFIPDVFKNKMIVFAGFVRLTKAEENLYKFFWERGAAFLWHSDGHLKDFDVENNIGSDAVHYSCADHLDWLKNWGTKAIPLSQPQKDGAKVHFFSGYDMHSQLDTFQKDLSACLAQCTDENIRQGSELPKNMADNALAVLLPSPSLLMPVLHGLEEKEVNISMGYPVLRTLFGQYLELILHLQEEKDPENQYVWRDVLALLRHPYTRMIMPYEIGANHLEERDFEREEKEKSLWLSLLYYLEKKLRAGTFYVPLQTFLDEVMGDIDNKAFPKELEENPHVDTFLNEFIHHTVIAWEKVQSLEDIAFSLEQYVEFLLKYGSYLWQAYPLDAESLVRLMENIIPSLRNNALSKECLSQDTLFMLLRGLIEAERIPFEADPLQGLQVLGMLESRLLSFKNLFILDMIEDNLPAVTQSDPLMPDSIRKTLRLPDTHKREILVAHTFYRLLAGAEHVWLYWQEGMQASSEVQTGKRLRSRFVEECLWKEELTRGSLLNAGEELWRVADCKPSASQKEAKKSIPLTSSLQNTLCMFLEKPLSATALDTYIKCPAKFFYDYLARLSDLESVNEGDDARELGNWIHSLFQAFYTPQGKESAIFEHDDEALERLLFLFQEWMKKPEVERFTAPESFFMLQCSGEYHLKKYFEKMPRYIKPLSLEEDFTCDVPYELFENNSLNVNRIKLRGRFDRVDIRVNGLVDNLTDKERERLFNQRDIQEHWILDYKTGKKYTGTDKIWNNVELWDALLRANHERTQGEDNGLLQMIAENLTSIQLPLYLYMYGQMYPKVLCNAAWIFLAEEEPEHALVSMKKEEEREEAWDLLEKIKTEFMPKLLEFVINHMVEAKSFEASEGKACMFCPHKDYC